MTKRKVVLVQSATSKVQLLPALHEWGWEVYRAGEVPQQGWEAGRQPDCDVGIAVIDDAATWPAAGLEKMTLDCGMEWAAVIGRAVLDSPALSQLIARNFHDFHTLPLDLPRLRIVLGHMAGKARLAAAADRAAEHSTAIDGIVGASPGMRHLYRAMEKVARFEAPVLISGESGTGKEVTARAVHRLSARRRGPFIAVNCGSLPVNLVHSELFGHEKGSFTGAHQRKIGSIEAAAGGVIFLDEIGDLPLELQSSLLRFLQEKTIVRLGSTQPLRIDTRVIAASHVDLAAAVKRGRFREDLFYRLNVLHLHLPALRERAGDIELLARSFFGAAGSQKSPQVAGFSTEAIAVMNAYSWPGNVRELMNRVQKAMIMCERRLITPEDLGLGDTVTREVRSLRDARGSIERDVIRQTLMLNVGNVAATARQLGVSRTTLYRLLQKFDIEVRLLETERGRWSASHPVSS